MKSLSWLHFSDLHYGMHKQNWHWPTIKELFYKDIAKLTTDIGPWDFVIFSGDLTQSGAKEQFDGISKVLEELWTIFSKNSLPPILICAPGNHDLERPDILNPATVALQNWHNNEQLRDRFWSSNDNEYKKFVDCCFENYTTWHNNITLPKPNILNGFLAGDYSCTTEIKGIRIGIISLNTAFLQLTGINYQKKLSLHQRQLLDVCESDPEKWFSKLDLGLLVTHHGPDWLHPSDLDIFKSQIYPPERFFAHHFGHMHKPYTQEYSEYGSKQRRLRQAPSLFGNITYDETDESDENKSRIERIHGYIAGRYRFEDDKIIEELYPRKLIKAYGGHYKIGADEKFDINDDGFITTIHNKLTQVIDTITINIDDHAEVQQQSKGIDLVKPRLDLFNTTHTETTAIKIAKHIIKPLSQHKDIRCIEQEMFVDNLRNHHCSILVSDWGYGKEGFIYSALYKFNNESLDNIFRISCEEIIEPDDILTVFETQLGISLQEFCHIISLTKNDIILMMDDIPHSFITETSEPEPQTLSAKRIIHSVLDFCPNIFIIITTRQYSDKFSFTSTSINPLEPHEIRKYLSNHPKNSTNYNDPDVIEIIHMRSGGLPMHIDNILENIQITSIDSIFDIDIETIPLQEIGAEPVPKALIQAVASIEKSEDLYSRRGFKLLKVLSILSDGEALNTIKWFYLSEPFQPKCGIELLKLSLISRIEQPTISKDLSLPNNQNSTCESPLISVKVPRQVRDFVLTLIDEQEFIDIVNRSAEILFGERWREGVIKLLHSKSFLSNSSRCIGLGNEHRIIHHLLKFAMQNNDQQDIRRAANLATSYCQKLYSINRYRDASIAAEEFLFLLENSSLTKEYTKLATICGKALRMAGKIKKAIPKFIHALESSQDDLSKDQKAEIHLGLALAYERIDESDLAIQSAETVKELSKKHSSRYLQAQAIITSLTLNGDEKNSALKAIEQKARQNKSLTVANNILLELADEDIDSKQKMQYYENVIKSSADDPYNKIRATLKKASLLIEQGKVSQLTILDRISVQNSYSYLFSQRLTSLFNQCHEVTWQLFKTDNQIVKLLRLFRYSSFLWRIRGIPKEEQKYLSEISKISPETIKQLKNSPVAPDVTYYESRMTEAHPSS